MWRVIRLLHTPLAVLAVLVQLLADVLLWAQTGVFWTIGAGPFPATLTCLAFDGCYLSNLLTVKWATSVALNVDSTQTSCMFLPYGGTYVFNITFSNSPLDGLQVRGLLPLQVLYWE